jgi:antigen flippase
MTPSTTEAELSASSQESLSSPLNGSPKKRSYDQILKSSALVGGSAAANIVIRIVRSKVMAILLGPEGVGLAGLYSSITDLAAVVAGMGVNSSGVREIAAAAASDNSAQIAKTTVVLRRVCFLLGLFGAVLLIAFSRQISVLSFGNTKYTAAICLLSVTIFLRLVSDGQGALIQGMRRISDLAKMSVLGGFLGTVATILVIFFLREEGIVPSMIVGAAVALLISWRYSRKIRIDQSSQALSELGQKVHSLLKLGLAFMVTSLMTMGSAYIVRIIILRQLGLQGAGLYQSAWALGGLYVGFILQAMGADFYPRLTACAHDNSACNRLVNEQAFIGLLLAGPGILGTLTFAPLIITIFYSAKFYGAVHILRWLCLGTFLQVISWPMGFIILAKGRQNVFLLSDFAWTVVYLGLADVCVHYFGIDGAGMAFFGSYIFHVFLTYAIVRRMSGFHWTNENLWLGVISLCLIAVVFCALYVLPLLPAVSIGILGLVGSGTYTLWILLNLISPDRLPIPMRRFLSYFRSMMPGSVVRSDL